MTFEIAHKWIFFLLPLPLLVIFLIPAVRRKSTALIFPYFLNAVNISGQNPRRAALILKRNWLQFLILLLTWICVLAALSSPQLVGKPEMTKKTTRSFLIAADLSFSMDTRDWVNNGERMSRWEAVRELMEDFISTREGDRMGLIFFGTNAYMQAPLTSDLGVIRWNLKETEVGMAGQMTGIGNAIGFAVKLFDQDTLKQKVLLILTDGVDSGSDVSPLDAASLAKNDSVVIYTLGIGSPGKGGAQVDETSLKEIARLTGGDYFLAEDTEQLANVYETINKIEPIEYKEENYKPVILLYKYPLFVAMVLTLTFLLINSIVKLFKKA